jgi:hypothetical protein
MALLEWTFEEQYNPMDSIEEIVSEKNWLFERLCDEEIAISITGAWATYQVSIAWMVEQEALHLVCSFDMTAPEKRYDEFRKLLSMINEQMLMGHFDFWADDQRLMYRHGIMLNGGIEATEALIVALLSKGVESCERYYEAFQYLAWAGKDAKEALECCVFETVGEA